MTASVLIKPFLFLKQTFIVAHGPTVDHLTSVLLTMSLTIDTVRRLQLEVLASGRNLSYNFGTLAVNSVSGLLLFRKFASNFPLPSY